MGKSIKQRIAEIPRRTDPVDRHFYLLRLVDETYSRRHNTKRMRQLCEQVCQQHVREFPRIAKALLDEDAKYSKNPSLPHVTTFQHLATLLTEKGDYSGAIRVCRRAISFGLWDGTKGGYEGRIERIRRLRDSPGDREGVETHDAKHRKRRSAPRSSPEKRSEVPRFKRYYATEKDMNTRQQEFYDRWRESWNRKKALAVDGNISYLFAYTTTVLARGPKRCVPELRRLSSAYEGTEREFSDYCRRFISDCFVVRNDYRAALKALPPLNPSSRSAVATDRLLSLKRVLRDRICGRDVLTLNGPKVTKWGRTHLSLVEHFLDVAVAAFEQDSQVNLINEWARPSYSHRYPTVFDGQAGAPASRLKAFSFSRNKKASAFVTSIMREAENTAREELDLPQVGEGWIAETELFYKLKRAFPGTKVVHHARLKWLGRQHLDMYIPSMKVAVEYQGPQHDEPLEYFGGKKAFEKTKRRDELKAKKCRRNGVRLLYARHGYRLRDLIGEIVSE